MFGIKCLSQLKCICWGYRLKWFLRHSYCAAVRRCCRWLPQTLPPIELSAFMCTIVVAYWCQGRAITLSSTSSFSTDRKTNENVRMCIAVRICDKSSFRPTQHEVVVSDPCIRRHNGEQTDGIVETTKERCRTRDAPECNFLSDDRSPVRRTDSYQEHACRQRRLTTVTHNKLVISFAQQPCKLRGRPTRARTHRGPQRR